VQDGEVSRFAGIVDSAMNVDMNYQETVNTDKSIQSIESSGLVRSYEIIDVSQSDSIYKVRLSVSVLEYVLDDAAKRLRIAVLPFRTSEITAKYRNFEREFSELLVQGLTQSKKFTVLDRDFAEEQARELGMLNSDEFRIDDMAKLGNKLSADLIVVGSVEEIRNRKFERNIGSSGRSIPMVDRGAKVNYRLLETATGQIRYANKHDSIATGPLHSVEGSMANTAGKMVVQQILSELYPIRAEKFVDGILVLGRGGDTLVMGQKLRLVKYGEEIRDGYTNESLGNVEKEVGVVEIVSVNSSHSNARVVSASVNLVEVFNSSSFIVRPIGSKAAREADSKQFEKVKNTGKKKVDELKEDSSSDW
jgi:curli biogenesis system outer membrane secretion channel CsgG